MKKITAFLAGFTAGWIVRSTVDSSRGVTVGAIAAVHELIDRTRRYVAVEREHIEDLLAEGRAHYEARRARDESTGRRGARTEVPRQERAS